MRATDAEAAPAVSIELSIEAGDWPPEDVLRALSERASREALAVLPPPSMGRAGEGGRPHSPPPQPSAGANSRELSILFTDDAAVRVLNAAWRGEDRPTNVLSFPQPPGPLLGDVVLAAGTVRAEAGLAQISPQDHIAHLIVHAVLHLLGYDHEEDAEAEEMEALETAALARMGIADPYAASGQDS